MNQENNVGEVLQKNVLPEMFLPSSVIQYGKILDAAGEILEQKLSNGYMFNNDQRRLIQERSFIHALPVIRGVIDDDAWRLLISEHPVYRKAEQIGKEYLQAVDKQAVLAPIQAVVDLPCVQLPVSRCLI